MMTTYQLDFHGTDEPVSAYTFFEAPSVLDATSVMFEVIQRRRANKLLGMHALRDATGKILKVHPNGRSVTHHHTGNAGSTTLTARAVSAGR